MKFLADFREIARMALQGRWMPAVAATLIAGMLGGATAQGTIAFTVNVSYKPTDIPSSSPLWKTLFFNENFFKLILVFLIVAVVAAVLVFLLGSIVSVGHAKYYLDVVDSQYEVPLSTLFAYFARWKVLIAAHFLQLLYVFVGFLLFIVPGVIASYDYAMTKYILAENPHLSASQALNLSKDMMYGNKFRFFCLQLSFIGWDFLCALTLGIGTLWLAPYRNAAYAAFYREISETEVVEYVRV